MIGRVGGDGIYKTTQQTKFQNNGKTGIITRTNECQHNGQLELF